MAEDKDLICYELLLKVFRDNAYASIELNSALKRSSPEIAPYVTKLFYGVLEKSIYYDYVISKFATQKPKKPIAVIIKMGYYALENLNVPQYAVVNNMVNLCKKVGKGGASGFVNSVLRNFKQVELPKEGSLQYLSVRYSVPEWLCKVFVDDYGYDFTQKMLSYESDNKTHIRVNTANITQEEFESKYCLHNNAEIERSKVGYYVSGKSLKGLKACDYVVQSASSIAAVYAYLYKQGNITKILDLCAAPGGKSVLLKTLTGAEVTACDIHKHRVELISQYATKASVKINAMLNDATQFRPEWENKFDLVVCDVPCSGLGVIGSKPDILYNRTRNDIDELVELQKKILLAAARYVKPGGRLCYSTCTVIHEENSGVVNDFLDNNDNFIRELIKSPYDDCEKEEITLFPHINRTDGFYVAALKKKTEK